MERHPVLVIGAGPAGLAAGHELARRGLRPLVLEMADKVGGLARTETHRGCRFDIGGHRFYTTITEVRQLWQDMLGKDFLTVPRLSRIYYDGRFFKYPLSLSNALGNLGLAESCLILLSYLRARARPHRNEDNFEQWVTNRFGARLYRKFFRTYTEKVWGMPCRSIGAEWAAQRVGGLSLLAAVRSALFGSNGPRTLISEFRYPVLGPGMMWQRFGQAIATFGGQVRLNCEVVELRLAGGRVAGVLARQQDRLDQLGAEQFISSMPLDDLVARLSPPPPEEVLRAAAGLRYRSLVLVGLILNRPDLFPDNWIYIHDPAVRVGRIQNFRNWSAAMVPDGRQSCLGMEYFCTQGDDLWMRSDREMVQLAGEELVRLGLARPENLQDGAVVRQPKAYPVYDAAYRANVQVVRSFLATLGNFQTVGRNGMHRYNNQDHSMLTGILAARNLLGQDHDLWKTGADGSYLEARAAQPSRRRR